MEQILCPAFINNDLVITLHSAKEEVQQKGKAYLALIHSKGCMK
jgi:hypothetical protein